MLAELPGRAEFTLRFQQKIAGVGKDGVCVSLAVIDIDMFGKINTAAGREISDHLLEQVAEALGEAFAGEAEIFRFGGDAFALIWQDVEKEQAFLRLEAFRVAIMSRAFKIEWAEDPVNVTVSVGVASCPDDGGQPNDILNKAHEALYRAKVSGRNKICLAREEKMVTKTSHYMQGQLMGLRRLAEREGIGEAVLLREGLNDLLRKYNA